MEDNLRDKHPYETPKVKVLNMIEEDSILFKVSGLDDPPTD